MSIIYKGLNPKYHYGLCILTINGELITANGKHFQAIQIPTPHGRIIDADLFKEIIKDSVPAWTIGVKIPTYGDMDIMDKIYYMPTILESED